MTAVRLVIPFRDVDLSTLPEVGGKNASLGELLRSLEPAGVRVPDGFAITAEAFRRHLAQGGAAEAIYAALDGLDVRDVAALGQVGAFARERIRALPLPADVREQLLRAYEQLSRQYDEAATDVAVRSSATAEDLPSASFAGQQESYLNVRGAEALLEAVRDCMASLFTDRAIVYRAERGFRHRDVALSVGVQKMVRSDLASAGVMFTLDTESGHRGVVTITGSWGLGESVVKGRVNPGRDLGVQADARRRRPRRSSGASAATRRSSWCTATATARPCSNSRSARRTGRRSFSTTTKC